RYSSTGGWYSWGEWSPPCSCSAMAVVPRRRHVESGVAVEEAEGDKREARVLDRHDRPVLRPRNVGDAEGVPQHDVGIGQGAVLLGPLRQAGGTAHLAGSVPRHP